MGAFRKKCRGKDREKQVCFDSLLPELSHMQPRYSVRNRRIGVVADPAYQAGQTQQDGWHAGSNFAAKSLDWLGIERWNTRECVMRINALPSLLFGERVNLGCGCDKRHQVRSWPLPAISDLRSSITQNNP
jgi:hypothetical protein